MRVTFVKNEEPSDFLVVDLKLGEAGIITHTFHGSAAQVGDLVIGGCSELIFPRTGTHTTRNTILCLTSEATYRCRLLTHGEKIIIEADV